jgi:putative PEP-CTERM system histidine kinase
LSLLCPLSYGSASLSFMLLGLWLLLSQQSRGSGGWLIGASIVTCVWAALLAYDCLGHPLPLSAVFWADVLHDAAWLLALSGLTPLLPPRARKQSSATLVPIVAGVLLLFALLYERETGSWLVRAGLAVPVTGLVLLVQRFRQAGSAGRWAILPLAAGLGLLFAYDAFLFALASPGYRGVSHQWQARGFIDTLAVPLLAIAAQRNPNWSLEVFVSRQTVLFGAAVLAAAAYLAVALGLADSLGALEGRWARLTEVVFGSVAILALTAVAASRSLRRHAHVFLIKHFYRNKYDYRREWLRFVDTLSTAQESQVQPMAIRAVADIFASPAGVLLTADESGQRISAVAAWPLQVQDVQPLAELHSQDPLCTFLRREQWIIDLFEYRRDPGSCDNVEIPAWLREATRWRIAMPMIERERLVGIMLLESPPHAFELTFEDRDLMRTAGRHVAARIAQQESGRRLAEAKQFEAYNRLAAFMMHDLQNSTAQLQLIVANAVHHKHKPEFVDDAVDTIANTSRRINDLIRQIKGEAAVWMLQLIDLPEAIGSAVRRCADRQPIPGLGELQPARIRAERGKFDSILEHIIRNAQDATPASGQVTVSLRCEQGAGHLEVRDTGSGMDPDFVRERLFRPFESTKGPSGMGIGAYQVREYVLALGGEVRVSSQRGVGTRFTIVIPLEPDA